MVDQAAAVVRWRDGAEEKRAMVAGAFDARYDPAGDRLLVLTSDGAASVAILSRDGMMIRTVRAPAGYAVSHFSDSDGAAIVCQGEAPDGDWWDWHFELDEAGMALRRTGPAY